MVSTQKIRINNLAKDLNMKSKDLLDALTASGVAGKTSTGTLDATEFSVLFDSLTSTNQITNMADYLAGKADIDRPKEEIKEEKPVAKAEPAEKKAEVPKAPAEEKKPQPQAPQQKPQGAQSAQPAKPQAQAPQQGGQKSAQQTENRPARQQQNQPKVNFPQQAERGASRSADRFARPSQAQNQPKKPEPRREAPSQPTPQPKKAEMRGGGESVEAGRKTRVIDTRASSVDLSKYDERLESFVPESARRSNVPDKQKVGKKPQNGKNPYAGRRGDKDAAALAKLRKAELEKIKKQPLKVTVPDEITVSELAAKFKVTVGELIKKLIGLGVMATANQSVDYDTAFLVGEEMNIIVSKEVVVTIEEKLFSEDAEDSSETLEERPPVVCVMGHVDHGKTSLLDAIRNTHVTAGEAGGITQSIGAYRVKIGDKYITFLDTPGHEAFTAMRARGAKSTDIAILVVAADDGIMPQTVEAINHAKAAGISIIVAINKMDKPGANPEGIKQELTKYDLVPEEWGGDVMCVPVSALKKTGIDDLLEDVLLIAEMKELKANPNRRAKGIVIEASLKKGLGPVATVLVQNGTLHQGDTVIVGTAVGRVRMMRDENGKVMKSAEPSVPCEIVGLDSVPSAGDEMNAVEDERMARELAEQRRTKEKEAEFSASAKVNLDDLFAQIKDGVKDLNIVVKADVRGSAEAVKASLVKLSNDEVKVNVIHTGVGGITENDVMLANASNAIIVGFNVRPDKAALDSAQAQGVDVRTYRIIYECIEEIEAAIKGMLKPVYRENVLGHAQVRQTIHVPNVGTIAGSYVQDGKITRASLIRVVRDGVVIFEDKISSLRRFKDDVKEVASGYECGVGLEKFNDIKEGDILEAYIMEEIAR